MSEKKAKKKRVPKVLHEVKIQLTDGDPNLLVNSPPNVLLTINLLCEAIKVVMVESLATGSEPSRIISPHSIIPGGYTRA